jgi:hypothetical protein
MEQTPDWSVNGIQTVEDAIRNEMTDLLLKTAICLCKNADKRPSSPMTQDGSSYGSRHIGAQSWGKSDQENYGFYDPLHNLKFKTVILDNYWLFSVYNRSVRDLIRYGRMLSGTSVYGVCTQERANISCSPFEHIPIHMLQELCEVYPRALQEFDSLIPANIQYGNLQSRKEQDRYIGMVNQKSSTAYQMIDQIITRFVKELDDEHARIYREAKNEGRTLSEYNARPFLTVRNEFMEYKDEFRLYDIYSLKHGLITMGQFLNYPFRGMNAFTIHGQQTYSGQEPIPYSSFQSNLAELVVEAIQCHYDMISRLIVLRLTLEKGQNTIEKKNVPYIRIQKLGNNINNQKTNRRLKTNLPGSLRHDRSEIERAKRAEAERSNSIERARSVGNTIARRAEMKERRAADKKLTEKAVELSRGRSESQERARLAGEEIARRSRSTRDRFKDRGISMDLRPFSLDDLELALSPTRASTARADQILNNHYPNQGASLNRPNVNRPAKSRSRPKPKPRKLTVSYRLKNAIKK